jgi:hypothetical protein
MKKLYAMLSLATFVAVAAAAAVAAVCYIRSRREEALAELEDEMYDADLDLDFYAEVEPIEDELGEAADDAHPLEH